MAAHAERLKLNHAPFMRTLHGEIRRHPGGYAEIARELGRPAQTLINMFAPLDTDTAPPADLLLDVMAIVRARGALGLLAGEIGCGLHDERPMALGADAAGWRRVVVEMGDALVVGGRALDDGRFDAAERVQLAKELDDVIRTAQALRQQLLR